MTEIQKTAYPNKTFAMFNVPSFRHCDNFQNADLKPMQKAHIAACAFLGAIVPVVILNSFKKGRMNDLISSFKNNLPFRDKFKNIWKMFEIENYFQILATTTGGVFGGLLGGLKFAKNKEDKEAKYKESIFEFLNSMTPTTLVALGLKTLEKNGKSKSIPLEAGIILSSVAGGMFIANKASNKINELIFDKNKKKEDKDTRNFKPTDCLVHVDDILNLAVLAKIPYANKLQVDKLLPLIYARTGYEVGNAKKKKSNNKI